MTAPPPPPGGKHRTGVVQGWELRRTQQRDANSGAWKGIAFVVGVVVLIAIGGWFVGRPYIGTFAASVFEDAPGIIRFPVIGDLVAAELGDRASVPAGSGGQEIEFQIEPGQTVKDIETNLVEQGLLDDTLAFNYLVVSDRIDQLIQAGQYTMTPPISPEGLAALLKRGPDLPPAMTTLDMRPARRIEQYVAYLQQQVEDIPEFEIDPKEFRQIATDPGSVLRDQYGFLSKVPDGNSLEGFLLPGTYEVPVDISAQELIDQMLERWEDAAGGSVTQARKKGVDFYDMLIVASLVEREAKKDSDRAKIAGVYWNRLNPKVNKQTDGLLQADPTVVYATDSVALNDLSLKKWDEYLFWDLLGLSDYSTVDVPRKYDSFQTYQNAGLPDWPIVTPSAKSIEAALNPNTKAKHLFFYACPGKDTHKFTKTFTAHQRVINQCN